MNTNTNRKTFWDRWCCCIVRLRPRRKRQLLFRLIVAILIIAVITTGIMLYKMNYYQGVTEDFFRDMVETLSMDMMYLSPSCAIPWMEPHIPDRISSRSDGSIMQYNQRSVQPECRQWTQPFVDANDTSIFLSGHAGNVRCCYTLPESDECHPIPHDGVNILQHGSGAEYVRVNCDLFYLYKSSNIFSFIRDKPKVEHRLEEWRNKGKPKRRFNVLVLGLDGVSRAAFHRQLPVTTSILQKMGMVEMLGYASLGMDPSIHATALLTGLTKEQVESKGCGASGTAPTCPLVWKIFSTNGFRTMRASDCPSLDVFYDAPVDYNFRPIAQEIEKNMAHQRGKPSSCYICAGEKTQIEVMLSYVEKFSRRFQNDGYWGMAWSHSLSQDNLAGSARADLYLSSFLNKAEREGIFKNTALIVISDRGAKETGFAQTYRGQLEMRLPTMIVILPQKLKRERPEATEAFVKNSMRFTTPFDLHATFLDLAEAPLSPSSATNEMGIGRSLFQLVPENRTCKYASIPPEWCFCITKTDYSQNSDVALGAAQYLEDYVKRLLSPYGSMCRPWKLHNVLHFQLVDHPFGLYVGKDLYPHVTYLLKVTAGEDWTEYRVPMLLWFPEKWTPKSWQERWYVHEVGIEPLNATSHSRYCPVDVRLRSLCYCNSTSEVSSKQEHVLSSH